MIHVYVRLWVCVCVCVCVCVSPHLNFHISGIHGRSFNETCQNYSLLGPHEDIYIYKVNGSKVSVSLRNLMNLIALKSA